MELAWGRPPTPEEPSVRTLYLSILRRSSATQRREAADDELEAWAGLTRLILASNEFLYVD